MELNLGTNQINKLPDDIAELQSLEVWSFMILLWFAAHLKLKLYSFNRLVGLNGNLLHNVSK